MNGKIDVHHHFVPKPYIDGRYNPIENMAPPSMLTSLQHSPSLVETHQDGVFQIGAQTAAKL